MNDWSGFQNFRVDAYGFIEEWSADLLLFETGVLNLSDSLQLTETLRLKVEKGLIDTLSLSEVLRLRVEKELTDALQLTEVLRLRVEKSLADTLQLTETLRLRVEKMIAEDLELDEQTRLEIRKVLTDTVLLSENLDVEFIAGVINLSVGDTLVLTDTLRLDVARILQDSIGLSEDISMAIAHQLSDSVQFIETLTPLFISGAHPDPIVIVPSSETALAPHVLGELLAAGKVLDPSYYEPTVLIPYGVRQSFILDANAQSSHVVDEAVWSEEDV